jgi:uncharacterized damage-inducible protein DinB
MAMLDEHGRPEPPLGADEATTLVAFLEFQRATIAWKSGGLDATGLRATTAASSMTLGGMLKHLTYVEDLWCSRRLLGNDPAPPWNTVDWDADIDWDWNSAANDAPEELQAMWESAVARSRGFVADALADGGLDRRSVWIDDYFDEAPTLRWVLVHLIREYARHCGQADLLREAVDGVTGE